MILIGFSGPAGCGKDTAADALGRHYPSFERAAFADPIKAGICEMFKLSPAVFESRENKETIVPSIGRTPRDLTKIIGQCVREEVGETAWIGVMAYHRWKLSHTALKILAITDVRFENEAEWVRAMGGTIIHVVRTGVKWNSYGHESERGIQVRDEDLILHNRGTVEEFERKAVEMFANVQQITPWGLTA